MLKEKSARYHKECYKSATNKVFIERLRARFAKQSSDGKSCEVQEKDVVQTSSLHIPGLRSRSTGYDRTSCIICQENEGDLHNAMSKAVGEKMFNVAKLLPEKGFFLRLNSIPNAKDAVANDVKYHLRCWVEAQRKVKKTESDNSGHDEDLSRILADIDIINMVDTSIRENSNEFLTMNEINEAYNEFIDNEHNNKGNYKSYLKELIQRNVKNVSFTRPNARNAPERVCSKKTVSCMIENEATSKKEKYFSIFESAKTIRNEILKTSNWQFTGSYDGFEVPKILHCMVKWILVGGTHPRHRNLDDINVKVGNISQIIMKLTKTNRQINYKPVNPSASIYKSRLHNETPFSVGLGLHIHKETRSKKIVDCLEDLGLSIGYDSVMDIENTIADKVTDVIDENNGAYIPHTIQNGVPIHFAIDNNDFHNDTPDGKGEFHGTGQIIFQKMPEDIEKTSFKIDRSKSSSMKYQGDPFSQTFPCSKPTPPNESFSSFNGIIPCDQLQLYTRMDRAWAISQVLIKQYRT